MCMVLVKAASYYRSSREREYDCRVPFYSPILAVGIGANSSDIVIWFADNQNPTVAEMENWEYRRHPSF